MKRMTVVLLVLVLSSLACSRQIATAIPTTPTTTPTSTAEPLTTPTTTVWTTVIRMAQVNIRETPGGASVAVLRKGVVVEIVSCDGSWCEIKEPAGYVWRGCLSDNPDGLGCRSK